MPDSSAAAPFASTPPGRVYLVGAGPGDPGLIAVRGVECLRRADLVLYDYLVNPRLLEYAARAELVCLGRHGPRGHGRMMSHEEVLERMIAAARQGQQVVRLKSGDPAIFARNAEELAALEKAGVPWEVTPGVTVALAAGSYAGIPITHRDYASAAAIVTGHEDESKLGQPLDWAALAQFPGTLVVYMGVTTADVWSGALLAAGRSPDTPVAVVRRCTWPDQQTVRCTLGTVADEIQRRRLRPPAIAIVGSVVNASFASWFVRRPLFGRRVLVTRPAGQIDELRILLEEHGAEVLGQPAIEIGSPDDFAPLDGVLDRLPEFDWLAFSSSNGVRAFFRRLLQRGGDLRRLGAIRLAAVGPGTQAALAEHHLRADVVPPQFRAEELAAALLQAVEQSTATGGSPQRFLLIRASRGREVLAETLTAAGHHVEQAVAYASRDVALPDPEVAADLAAGRIDWVTVTSSAIARSLVQLFGDDLRKARLASISPITSATLRSQGFEADAEAVAYTMPGVAEAIVAATSQTRGPQSP